MPRFFFICSSAVISTDYVLHSLYNHFQWLPDSLCTIFCDTVSLWVGIKSLSRLSSSVENATVSICVLVASTPLSLWWWIIVWKNSQEGNELVKGVWTFWWLLLSMRLYCFLIESGPFVIPSATGKCHFNIAWSTRGVIVFLKLTSKVDNGTVLSVVSQQLALRYMPWCLQLVLCSLSCYSAIVIQPLSLSF